MSYLTLTNKYKKSCLFGGGFFLWGGDEINYRAIIS